MVITKNKITDIFCIIDVFFCKESIKKIAPSPFVRRTGVSIAIVNEL